MVQAAGQCWHGAGMAGMVQDKCSCWTNDIVVRCVACAWIHLCFCTLPLALKTGRHTLLLGESLMLIFALTLDLITTLAPIG